ncbi:Phenylalanine--tRNA ligase beta subunit [Frankliniella fusca]|uniref:Phenylalanine--tRNA ligase beta subunit n=1 Tax=Frankliniella fusca TaxID=407009 RepID=A0AAE1GWB3_9NEOP|nr:Phenylalanine--tRNA ligase beta subunit [Frankliniella fusca]
MDPDFKPCVPHWLSPLPDEPIGVISNDDLDETKKHEPDYFIHESDNVVVDEVDVKHKIKSETCGLAYSANADQVQETEIKESSKLAKPEIKRRTTLSIKKAMAIARAYAELSGGDVRHPHERHPTPLSHFRGPSVLIRCPRCLVPSMSTHSVFLDLMIHIMNCHRKKSAELLQSVIVKYSTFIQYMKAETMTHYHRKFIKKLRSHTKK